MRTLQVRNIVEAASFKAFLKLRRIRDRFGGCGKHDITSSVIEANYYTKNAREPPVILKTKRIKYTIMNIEE